MAYMIPTLSEWQDFHGSNGEQRVYDALKENLPDDRYVVFYSTKWVKNNEEVDDGPDRGESDFLIFDKKRGFVTIEVKPGGIERTVDGTWYQIGKSGKHALRRGPMDQAMNCAEKFRKVFDGQNGNAVKDYGFYAAVWLTSIAKEQIKGKLPAEYDETNTLTRESFCNVKESVDRIFDGYNAPVFREDISHEELMMITKIFSPEFNVVPGMGMDVAGEEYEFKCLTERQKEVLDRLKRKREAIIVGASGTGKTMIALERIRRLPSDEKVLFLCFNLFLLEFLRKNYAKEMPNVSFHNLYTLRAEVTGEEDYFENPLNGFFEFLYQYTDLMSDYKHIVIDEGQDFYQEHLEMLRDAARDSGGLFYLFYDEKQNVHKNESEKTVAWLNSLEPDELDANCRNTQNIAKVAYGSVGIDGIKMPMASGEMPKIMAVEGDEKDEAIMRGVGEAVKMLLSEGFGKKDIVILTLKKVETSVLKDAEKVGKYKISRMYDRGDDEVFFTTARKYKGLEANAVIVVDFDGESLMEGSKNVFYVATSRAKHALVIVCEKNEESFLKNLDSLGVRYDGKDALKRLAKEMNLKVCFPY